MTTHKSKHSAINRKKYGRNNTLVDSWSAVHLLSGILFGLLINPIAAIIILALWEPFENFVLSPIFARSGILFGYESWRNALSDVIFDAAGVIIGSLAITAAAAPAVHLF